MTRSKYKVIGCSFASGINFAAVLQDISKGEVGMAFLNGAVMIMMACIAIKEFDRDSNDDNFPSGNKAVVTNP